MLWYQWINFTSWLACIFKHNNPSDTDTVNKECDVIFLTMSRSLPLPDRWLVVLKTCTSAWKIVTNYIDDVILLQTMSSSLPLLDHWLIVSMICILAWKMVAPYISDVMYSSRLRAVHCHCLIIDKFKSCKLWSIIGEYDSLGDNSIFGIMWCCLLGYKCWLTVNIYYIYIVDIIRQFKSYFDYKYFIDSPGDSSHTLIVQGVTIFLSQLLSG